jgi:uncharacterized protein (DUF885 family)
MSSRTPASDLLHGLFDDYWQHMLERDPQEASYLGDHRYGSKLRDYSEQAEIAHARAIQQMRERLSSIDRTQLDAADRLSAAIFERELAREKEDHEFRLYETPITQQSGLPLSFPELVRYHPLDTKEHGDDFVNRLRLFPSRSDQLIANMRRGIERGNVPWRGTIEKALPQMKELGEGEAAKHPLAEAVEKVGEGLSAGERAQFRDEVLGAIEDHVLPAYAKLHEFLEKEYLPACRKEPGISALPDGEKRYAYLVRRHTTTERSPREIHETGLAEMRRIRSDMERIVESISFDGDLPEFLEHLRTDSKFYCKTKEELVEGFREILSRMDAKLPELFGRLPQTGYDLTEIESYRAKAAPAAYYYAPPDDRSRPGYFYVNTYDLPSRPRYTMEALAYHEAVPGHHLQIALQQELDLPDFQRHSGFTAFVEGWALYSERLPKEVGFYADPYSEFGRLTFEAWRASRLVVDTGIHAFGWSRDKAIEYLEKNSALARHDIESEVDRYIAWPGQALAYKIGELEILAHRANAQRKLGERFDLREFHDAVLENGAVPLDILGETLNGWIVEVAANP